MFVSNTLYGICMSYKTFDEIVDEIVQTMDEDSRNTLKEMKKDDLIIFHHTAGRHIRNEYGLWKPDNPLISGYETATDETKHPDTVSMNIIKSIWEKVNKEM